MSHPLLGARSAVPLATLALGLASLVLAAPAAQAGGTTATATACPIAGRPATG